MKRMFLYTHTMQADVESQSDDVDPPKKKPKSTLDDNLHEHATVSEKKVSYRADVINDNEPDERENDHTKSAEKSNLEDAVSKLKVSKCRDFSVRTSDDKKNLSVHDLLVLANTVVVVDTSYLRLRLFDNEGNYLSSTNMKTYTNRITQVNKNKFATCGYDYKIFLWSLVGETIVSEDEAYDVDYKWSQGIHYNGTYYCVLHQYESAVTILDSQGRQVRRITTMEPFGKKVTFGYDIHMDIDTHDIYVPCLDVNLGVLCISVKGDTIWFTPLPDAELRGITEIHGALCVADMETQCLHLMSKTGQYIGKLLQKDDLAGEPSSIHYDEFGQKLYVSLEENVISVYSVTLSKYANSA